PQPDGGDHQGVPAVDRVSARDRDRRPLVPVGMRTAPPRSVPMPAFLLLLLCCPGGYQDAWKKGEMSVAETKAFMMRLLRYVEQHHLKTDPKSPQAGMVYEYFDTKGKAWVQGEALDTMHDGAWLCAALATAYKVTGDEDYLRLLRRVLPFY